MYATVPSNMQSPLRTLNTTGTQISHKSAHPSKSGCTIKSPLSTNRTSPVHRKNVGTAAPSSVALEANEVKETSIAITPRCACRVEDYLWCGERDGAISVRSTFDLDTPLASVGDHTAWGFPWTLCKVGGTICVGFSDGTVRIYPCKPLVDSAAVNQVPHHSYQRPTQAAWASLLDSPLYCGVVAAGAVTAMTCEPVLVSAPKDREEQYNVFIGSNDFEIGAWRVVTQLNEAQIAVSVTVSFIDQFSGHSNAVRALEVNKTSLFSASDDGTARQWDLRSRICVAIFSPNGHGPAPATPSEVRIKPSSACSTPRQATASRKVGVTPQKHSKPLTDRQRLFGLDCDTETATKENLTMGTASTHSLDAVAAAAAAVQPTVRPAELRGREPRALGLTQLTGQHALCITSAPDGGVLLWTGGEDDVIRVWSVVSVDEPESSERIEPNVVKRPLHTLAAPGTVCSMRLSNPLGDHPRVIAGCSTGVSVFCCKTMSLISTFHQESDLGSCGYVSDIVPTPVAVVAPYLICGSKSAAKISISTPASSITALHHQLASFSESVARANSLLHTERSEADALRRRNNTMAADLQKATTEIDCLAAELQQQKSSNDELRRRVHQLEAAEKCANGDNNALRTTLIESEKASNQRAQRIASLETEAKRAHESERDLLQQVQQLTETLHKAEAVSKSATARVQELEQGLSNDHITHTMAIKSLESKLHTVESNAIIARKQAEQDLATAMSNAAKELAQAEAACEARVTEMDNHCARLISDKEAAVRKTLQEWQQKNASTQIALTKANTTVKDLESTARDGQARASAAESSLVETRAALRDMEYRAAAAEREAKDAAIVRKELQCAIARISVLEARVQSAEERADYEHSEAVGASARAEALSNALSDQRNENATLEKDRGALEMAIEKHQNFLKKSRLGLIELVWSLWTPLDSCHREFRAAKASYEHAATPRAIASGATVNPAELFHAIGNSTDRMSSMRSTVKSIIANYFLDIEKRHVGALVSLFPRSACLLRQVFIVVATSTLLVPCLFYHISRSREVQKASRWSRTARSLTIG